LTYGESTTEYACNSQGSGSGNHMPGQTCNADPQDKPYSVTTGSWSMVAYCSDVDEIIFGDSGTIDAGQTGGGNNGSGSGIISIPLNIFTIQLTSFLNSLTPMQSQYLSDNINVYNDVTEFFEDNSFSTENETFASLAIDALLNDGGVDFYNRIIIDKTFKNSETKCIHDKLSLGNNFYEKLLSNFKGSKSNILKLKIGNTINGDWGITKGDIDNTREFTITISNSTENSSNLSKIVTLSHELIHAYMFDTLEDWGYIFYDSNNDPWLNINCPKGGNYNNVNLNTLTDQEKFVALICAMKASGTLTPNWTHALFDTSTFNATVYRQELENLILNEHDWNSESQSFKDNSQNLFGSNWKKEISKAVSWIGLEKTDGYANYINNYSSSIQQFIFIQQIRNNISNLNSDCK